VSAGRLRRAGARLLLPCGLPPALALAAAGGAAQAPVGDTIRVHELETVVVTAERTPRRLETSTGAVAILRGEQLRRLPLRGLADALQQVPGLVFLDFGGLGEQPQVTVRGFYGGGEAEYVVVLLDGVPLNAPEGGRVPWHLAALEAVESIEVLRGGASAHHGDAAVGAVVDIRTRADAAPAARWTVGAGQHGRAHGSLAVAGRAGSLHAELGRSKGYREHAARAGGSLAGSLALLRSPGRELGLSTLHAWRRAEDPGPLPGEALAASRTAVLPFYRFDGTSERTHRLGVNGRAAGAGSIHASGYLVAEHRTLDQVRTLPLGPGFADTRERVLHGTRLLGSGQVELARQLIGAGDRLLLGVDASLGRLTSEYHPVLQGPAERYREATFRRGDSDGRVAGERAAAAGFARYELRPRDALLLAATARLDRIRDRQGPGTPGEAEVARTHTAFSPRLGLNARYLDAPRQTGHLYLNLARSFKAPTPDQLFDRRPVPVPYPPYRIHLSNAGLRPQLGHGVEAGVYHRAGAAAGPAADLSLSAYRMEMRDEIDFDLRTFGYVNIGRSRHQGVETGVRVRGPRGVEATSTYTLQAVTARSGEHAGKWLKAVPRHSLSGGLHLGAAQGPAASVLVARTVGVFLDDANTLPLSGFTRVDLRLSHALRGVRLAAEVYNLLGREYSTTGFQDPAGSGVVYYYPAAGRVLELRIGSAR
jgi:iron complex outermembrane recepter protein